MTLDKTWKECLKMWKWIAEEYDGMTTIGTAKLDYFRKHNLEGVRANCFFCAHAITCRRCPGKLVDSKFHCTNVKYNYIFKPKEFYQELLRLNAIRLERKKNEKPSSNFQKN